MSYINKKKIFKIVIIVAVMLLIISAITVTLSFWDREENPKIGFSFSTYYAQYLGFDPKEVYEAMLTDMNIDVLRIPVYWSQIEPINDEYDFSTLDYMMQRAQDEGVGVTLAIGAKVPRWPECFVPSWVEEGRVIEYESQLFMMIQTVVNRYKNSPALLRWQVENEPFFPFGECVTPDPKLYKQEIELVRALDFAHEIQSTSSGEHAFWFLRTRDIDVIGVSLYREVWNNQIGALVFPYQPIVYILQSALANVFVDDVVISELQMEPWLDSDMDIKTTDAGELYDLFTSQDIQDNYYFAKKIGPSEIYFWGIEWWYFMKENGNLGLWNAGIEIINNR